MAFWRLGVPRPTNQTCLVNSESNEWSIFGIRPAPGALETLLKSGELRTLRSHFGSNFVPSLWLFLFAFLLVMAKQGPWETTPTSCGASQPAANLTHGAFQPVAGQQLSCGQLALVSFNFGIMQTMLDSTKQWTTHAKSLVSLLLKLGGGADIISGCELGGHRQVSKNIPTLTEQYSQEKDQTSEAVEGFVWALS